LSPIKDNYSDQFRQQSYSYPLTPDPLTRINLLFTDLKLNKALYAALEEMDMIHPTPIQEKSFPIITKGRDMIGIAQTGTGKTLAYLLPLIRDLTFAKDGKPRILVIVPTRELVVQVANEAEKLTKHMTVRVVGVYGGTNINTQKLVVMDGCDLVVATPGRLVDLALSGALNLKGVKKLVIDEVDEILQLGFRPQLLNILDLIPTKRQNLLFSATMIESVEKILDTFFNNPVKIEISPRGTPVEKIDQSAYQVPNFLSKVNLLQHLLFQDEAMNKVLVFVGTKKLADRLYEAMSISFGDKVGVIHSNKAQNHRLKTVKHFYDGTIQVLIATEIIARGLDILEVSHVINFDMPEVPEHYLHRIGRTGRADKTGISINFLTEEGMLQQAAAEALMNTVVPILPLPKEVEIVEELIPEEIPRLGGDKNYLQNNDLGQSKGAFHDKKLKNTKVNRAQEKRNARKAQKRSARRRKKR